MLHQGVNFAYPRRSGSYARSPHLPSELIHTRPVNKDKKNYSPTLLESSDRRKPHLGISARNSESRVHQPPKRRRRRRKANYKPLVVLVLTFVLGILMDRLLLSFLPTSCKAVVSPQQSAVLPSPVQINPDATAPVVALSQAIVGQESEEDFQSLNPHSGALGFAQIMPANLSAWSQEILGYPITPDEFLNNPELQMKIINRKLSEYWQKALADSNGDEELAVLKVASHWYSGNPSMYTSESPQWYKGKDGKLHRYPSVAEYSKSILKKYRKYKEGAA